MNAAAAPRRAGTFERAVVDQLLERGPLDRPTLASLVGISRPSAGELVSRLVATGLLEARGEVATGRRGPNSTLYALRHGVARVAGVELQPEGAWCRVADLDGTVLAGVGRRARPDDTPERLARRVVRAAAKQAGTTADALDRVTVAAPGVVGPDGEMRYVEGHPGWSQGLRARLADALELPTRLENDVKLAALAEQHGGAAEGVGSFVLLRLAESVSAAVVLEGRLLRGSGGAAGEIGYLPAWSTEVGGFGAPHLHEFLGARALSALLGDDADGASGGAGVQHPSRADDLRELVRRTAVAVVSCCAVVDPELVVVTGASVRAAGAEFPALLEAVVHEATPFRPRVRRSALDTDDVTPATVGALSSALLEARDATYGVGPAYQPASSPL
ncbi:ROK family protein [Lapillicoccus jejuensis]|uniref:Putative NBD/HSP70 family sugar kinase n=1 Tax=Lapillicoccus jejuensis TaxID=402171 RepID=A0A542E048_9MICO|nr:ROK family protein [Lapillicoccus jejuensis]TQJ08727.1 putative NBD/HSP70 family sugar kinase [Lapillicoccus jejuensis]